MMLRGQLERLIREGQVLAFEPDLLIHTELVFWHFIGHAVERCLGLFSLLDSCLGALFHSGVWCFFSPTVVQAGEVTQ